MKRWQSLAATISLLCAFACVRAQAASERVSIPGPKGKLAAVVQRPDGVAPDAKVPVVILCHGFGADRGGMFRPIADRLNARGVAAIRFDFDGHGESEGAFSDMTVPSEIADACAVYAYAARQPWAGKISILGHSQGGVVASMTAGQLGAEKIDKVVLLAPACILREDALRGNTMGAGYDPVNPPDKIKIWGGRELGGNYVRTARTLPIYETATRFTGPVCLIHGTDDRIAPYTASETFKREYKQAELHLLENDDHGLSKHFGEVLKLVGDFLAP